MRAVSFDAAGRDAWDDVWQRSQSAWLFHAHAWVGIESEHFQDENLSFALVEGDRVVGIQPLYGATIGMGWVERLVHSGIHRHTGLALRDDLSAGTVAAARSEAMRTVMAAAKTYAADRIQLNSQNLAPINMTTRREEVPFWIADHGFHLGLQFGPNGILPAPGMSTCCADQVVLLSSEQDSLFARLDESCRRAIRKATNAGLEFEVSTDEQSVGEYWRIAVLGAVRTGEKLAPRAYYDDIWHAFAGEGRCVVVFARHSGERVAGLILLVDKGAASFLAGVSDPAFLPVRVNDFLHWSAIQWAKSAGLAAYRLGPTFPEVPQDWPIATVSRFKGKFGGHSLSTIQGSLFINPQKYEAAAIAHLSALCARESLGTSRHS